MSDIYSKIFRGNFRNCLYGTLSMKDYLSEFENDKDYKYISEILDSSKQDIMTPLIEKNFKYICSLRWYNFLNEYFLGGFYMHRPLKHYTKLTFSFAVCEQ